MRFMKLIAHKISVTGPRPARNSSATGAPELAFSRTTSRVEASMASDGSNFASQSRARASRPFNTRNCSDSGSAMTIQTASNKGTRPPTQNTERQPKAGISAALTKPPSAAPSVKPHETSIIRLTRCSAVENSPTSAIAFGMMQPRPRPVTKRKAVSTGKLSVNAVAIIETAKKNVEPINTGLRPMRSASTDKPSAPSSMPKRLALKTGPSAAFDTCQSAMTAGAT